MRGKILALFLFLTMSLWGMNDSVAWRHLELYGASDGKEQVAAANNFMEQLYKENFIDQPMHFSRETPVDTMEKKVLFAATEYCFYELGNFEKTKYYGEQILSLCKRVNDLALLGECESILAVACFRSGKYVDALHHAHSDFDIQRKLGDISSMSSSLNTLAGIYLATKQYEEALKYIMKAIPLSSQANDSARIAIQMGMACEILQAMHRSEEALGFARKAYQIDSLRGNLGKASVRLSQMASALMDMERNDEAEKKLLVAIPTLNKVGNRLSLAICQNQMGELKNRKNDSKSAIEYYQQALSYFGTIGDKYNEAKTQKGLYKAWRDSDVARSLEHLERFSLLKDSIYSQEMKHNLSMAHAKFHNEELEQQNVQERKVKRLTLFMSLAVVLSLLILLGFVIFALQVRKKRVLLLKQLQEDKEQFFTNITHEFRTPLTIILGLSSRLKHHQLSTGETVNGVAEIIERQGHTLLELVNQLLDIARTDRVSLEADYRQDDVVGYIHMIVESCEELARQKHIVIQYEPSENFVKMSFVPDYLHKIVQNLLSNAIKFTSEHGWVRVSSSLSADSHTFTISVKDNGEGISPDLLPYIFESFTGRQGTDGEVSIGVGLTLVKKLVEALGGRIHVESQVGKGSTFIVDLPYLSCQMEMEEKTVVTSFEESLKEDKPILRSLLTDRLETIQPMASEDKRSSILVVEDNVDIYYYMEHVLQCSQYVLYHARNGEEGLEKAQAIVPDLIVTDIMMPLMDGYEMCRQLKMSQVTNHIPVIVVSARNTEADKLRGIDCGAECYLYKPFSAEELLSRVHNILEQRRILREKYMKLPLVESALKEESPKVQTAETLFMKKVDDYIKAHMVDGAIGVDDLAEYMCMSAKQLNRKMPSIVGYSVNSYIIQQRVARACHLLETSDEMISVVALKCGFDNPSNFTRTFKDCVGCSPSVWRKRKLEE